MLKIYSGGVYLWIKKLKFIFLESKEEMFKKLRGLKNEIENKLIKKDHDMERDLDVLMQKRKRIIALIQ